MPLIQLTLSYAATVFTLSVINTSQEPVRIWSTSYSSGYDSIYFRIALPNGRSCLIKRRPVRWTVNVPATIVIPPGQRHVLEMKLNDGAWDLKDCKADSQTQADVIAILEIARDQNTDTYGVITGHFESNQLSVSSLSGIVR